MASSGSNLTTSRINRLLRPLRSKCNSLAAAASSALISLPTATSTYSSRQLNWFCNAPPLALLQAPGGFSAMMHPDEPYMKTLELSRKIYAIRDCFQNLVYVSFGTAAKSYSCGSGDEIASLGAICSMIIGSTIQAEYDSSVTANSGEDEDHIKEEELVELANEIYEAIPPHYRRWTIVSHAVSIILNTCPHHSTLLAILLDVCLASNLVQESHILLQALLVASISPPNSSLPPISHPAHTSYLTELYFTWINRTNDHAVALCTSQAFVRILLRVLADAEVNVWACKAIARLARELRQNDFVSFVHIVTGLACALRNKAGADTLKRVKGTTRNTLNNTIERDRLNKWVVAMLNHLWSNEDVSCLDVLPRTAEQLNELQGIIEFLGQARMHGLHLVRAESDMAESKLPGSIVCLAVCCLAAISLDFGHAVRDLVNLLSESTPITTTFDGLVALIFSDGDVTRSRQHWNLDVMRQLRKQAALLRSHSLLKLEASLWACALRYMERDNCSRWAVRDELDEMKRQIIDAVDEAEKRCFGSAVTDSCTSKPSKRYHEEERHLGGEWEWEEMVGCWIRRSPLVKRRRLDGPPKTRSQRMLRGTQFRRARNPSTATSLTPSTPSSTVFSESSTCATSASPAEGSNIDDEAANHEGLTMTSGLCPKRRISNLFSILADAQTNRAILHRKRVEPLPLSLKASRAIIPKPPSLVGK